jgi:predicted MarR family transcription regulator
MRSDQVKTKKYEIITTTKQKTPERHVDATANGGQTHNRYFDIH